MSGLVCKALVLLTVGSAVSAEPVKVESQNGPPMVYQMGAASFADQVVSFQPGDPPAEADFSRPESALGMPDYIHTKDGTRFLSLGRGGQVTLEFVDNRLVDVDGPDLYVYEIGPTVEGTFVEISADGQTWISVGEVSGSTAAVDIAPFVEPGTLFRFVRLTDNPNEGHHEGRTAGADIDAVGCIGSVPAP